jgi:MFS superfamily sulfate permease-like transporter
MLAGSPLSVSGPAAGLTTLVFQLVSAHGLAALGPIVMLAGAIQVAAGLLRLGRFVSLIPHCVVEAMLAAIGLILLAAQLQVASDLHPSASFVANLLRLPAAVLTGHAAAMLLAAVTIAVTLGVDRLRLPVSRVVPSSLLGVVVATLLAGLLPWRVAHIGVPDSLLQAIALPGPGAVGLLTTPWLLEGAISLALIASLESLLSAHAVHRLTPGGLTRYSKELVAQGAGNMVCGVLGALPMTAVIVRSAANVHAGARTRASAVLHGVWLLALVALAPSLLRLVPTAALAGLLLVVGARLLNLRHVAAFARDGWRTLLVYAVTLVTILCTSLLIGVVAGFALHLAISAVSERAARPA